MYTKAEAAQRRQAFWTAFGQYMAPVPNADGEPTNWVNYRTGIKHIRVRLAADQRHATIALELTHPDAGLRALYYEQLQELRPVLHEMAGDDWAWEADVPNENYQTVSRISQTLTSANLFERDDWPALISFFKPRLVALDAFWSQARWGFEELG